MSDRKRTASRERITLHTGVLYGKTFSKSFCTISYSLRHDPSVIIAHITPILKIYLQRISKITHLHFFSDGPTTQCRNKHMFFLLVTHLPSQFKQISDVT